MTEQEESEKAILEQKLKNLENNNLGSKKRISKISKYKSRIASHINCELNKMVKNEDLKEIVREDLNWVSKKRNVSKKQQNRFSTWSKGLLLERLSIDADFNASINTKKRKFISEINIDTPYKEVKKYYENLLV